MTIERIWATANRKRADEQQETHDERLTAAIEAQACSVESGPVLCGAPFDIDETCNEHR